MATAMLARRSSSVAPSWHNALEGAGDFAHSARHDRGEQRLFAGEPRVDRRLSGTRDVGDLLNARALEAALEKYLSGRVQDPLFDLARECARRPAGSGYAARGETLSGRCSLLHYLPFT